MVPEDPSKPVLICDRKTTPQNQIRCRRRRHARLDSGDADGKTGP